MPLPSDQSNASSQSTFDRPMPTAPIIQTVNSNVPGKPTVITTAQVQIGAAISAVKRLNP